MPTDTTYGIICDATNIEAVKKVYEAKNRDFSKPLILLVSDILMLKDYVKGIDSLTQEIINNYWPGPLSILFLKNAKISDLVTAQSPYVAIRIPKSKYLMELIQKIGKPIVATSANISGSNVILNINEIAENLKKKVDFIVDGGTIKSEASTLIKIENNQIFILREGEIAKKIKKDYPNLIG